MNYKYRIIDIGKVKFEDIVKTEYYDLYAFLPLVDGEKREKEGEKYLKKCAEVIRDMPVDRGKKGYVTTAAQILAGIVLSVC